jgi:NAD-dependent deacetylase
MLTRFGKPVGTTITFRPLGNDRSVAAKGRTSAAGADAADRCAEAGEVRASTPMMAAFSQNFMSRLQQEERKTFRKILLPKYTRSVRDDIVGVAAWLAASTRIVALTGAGISTESGIPDFRGPQGVWTKNPTAEKLSNIHSYMSDPEVRKLAWKARIDHPGWHATPNAGHRALAALEQRGQLHALITQNIDGLHQRAGNSPEKVIEVHGTMHEVMCMSCGWRGPMRQTLDRVRAGEADPPCAQCGGILKSATISFGQSLVASVINRAFRIAGEADLLLAIGTSLQVYPIAAVVPAARDRGARIVIVNAEPTAFDDVADAVFNEPIGDVLPTLCGALSARLD